MRPLRLLSLTFATIILLGATINLNHLLNYASQFKPSYIIKDNTPPQNPITDKGATLGRVLFYDKKLSANNTVSCANCHQQQFAFGDSSQLSTGLYGEPTVRHSMRLVNARFGNETRFFWDERANSLEEQTTRPIQDHIEMGFSGENGDPDLDSLVRKIQGVDYYRALFQFVFGDTVITELRMQQALAQFVRSIQSFDSKFDQGRALAGSDLAPYINYTEQENLGKFLFLTQPPTGAGCHGCHRVPEFSIVPNTGNNGIIGVANNPGAIDVTNTRAPTLRDVFNPSGQLNGPLMHNGSFNSMLAVINHYNFIPPNLTNTNLDIRLSGPPNGNGQHLNLSQEEMDALIAFLRTLTGNNLYTDPKWSDPFDASGNLNWTPLSTGLIEPAFAGLRLYPIPARDVVYLDLKNGDYSARVFDQQGKMVLSKTLTGNDLIQVSNLQAGMYVLYLTNRNNRTETIMKFLIVP